MSNASSNQVSILSSLESSYNEAPDQTAAMRRVPILGDDLRPLKETVEDETINPDRSTEKSLLVSKKAAGTTRHGFDLLNYELFFKELLQSSALTTLNATTVSVTYASVAGGYTITPAGSEFDIFNGSARPSYVYISGATNTDHNGFRRVVSVSSGVITIAASGETTGADTISVRTHYYRNGSTRTSRLVEKHFGDIDRRHHYRGMEVNAGAIQIAAKEAIQCSFDWMGAQFGSGFGGSQTASAGDTGAALDPYAAERLTASNNVATIYNAGSAIGACVRALDINITNNQAEDACVGELVSSKLNTNGQFNVTGTISMLVDDSDLIEIMDGHTALELAFLLTDAAGNAWGISLPEIVFDEVDMPTEGRNTPVVQTYNFSASKDATLEHQIEIAALTLTNLAIT